MALIAAAEGRGDLPLQLEAAQTLGVGLDDLEEAERAGLMQVSESGVAFRHPLVATAAYQGAALARRVAVHRALAEVAKTPDCRAHHLPAATMEPDAGVAAELAAAAERTASRTAYAAAARLYEQAARLGPDVRQQVGWLSQSGGLRAVGRASRPGGRPRREGRELVEPGLPDAELTMARAAAMFRARPGEAGRPPAPGTRRPGRSVSGRPPCCVPAPPTPGSPETRARSQPRPGSWPRSARPTPWPRACPTSCAPTTRAACRCWWSSCPPPPTPKRALYTGMIIGDDATTMALAAAEVARCRENGLIGALPQVLQVLAQTQVWAGLHRDAEASVAEAVGIACDGGLQQRIAWINGVSARIAAIEGDEDRCRRLVGEAPAAYRATGEAVLGLLELSLGDHESALDRLEAAWSGPGRNAGGAAVLRPRPDRGRRTAGAAAQGAGSRCAAWWPGRTPPGSHGPRPWPCAAGR
ncbi:hypothetical protein [Nonomuraea dietziae]|uniref:hypothetical protein n=1 Tax=Nonomuraea dietziae TaxID=65515 RepID=UPI0031D81758